MSDGAAHYEIGIICVRVPDALEGIPLPVDIISENGTTKQVLITVRENAVKTEPVKAEGSYLVRAELPSGSWLAETATVLEPGGAEDHPSNMVTLDFGAEEPARVVPFYELITFAQSRDEQQRLVQQTSAKFLPSRLGAVKRPSAFRCIIGSINKDASLDYGLFVKWSADVWEKISRRSPHIVVIQSIGKTSTDLPGDITLQRHPGWTPSSTIWRPLVMRVRLRLPKVGALWAEALLIWPPSGSSSTLSLLPDPNPRANTKAPSLLAFSRSDNPTVDALFSFVRGGALDAARRAAPMLTELATKFLQSKIENPITATLAAYTLLKVGKTSQQQWVANLANWFEYLPDGAIIQGWYLIRAGQAEQACKYFKTALARGVPMYSEGVRLLRDGLNFLSGLYPQDRQLQADAARAEHIAAAANLDSELTCLRLGGSLTVQFVAKSEVAKSEIAMQSSGGVPASPAPAAQ